MFGKLGSNVFNDSWLANDEKRALKASPFQMTSKIFYESPAHEDVVGPLGKGNRNSLQRVSLALGCNDGSLRLELLGLWQYFDGLEYLDVAFVHDLLGFSRPETAVIDLI